MIIKISNIVFDLSVLKSIENSDPINYGNDLISQVSYSNSLTTGIKQKNCGISGIPLSLGFPHIRKHSRVLERKYPKCILKFKSFSFPWKCHERLS